MKKNVAGQRIGAQMITIADGSVFTGAVTVSVTGDAGTQATGSVGAGACTHEGNGYHTYAPAQAETNYDLVAFTFTGTGAIAATVQVFTSFPQTGDSFAEVNNGTYGLSAIETLVDGVETATTDIQGRLPAALVGGRMDSSVGAMAANVMTAAAAAADLTTELQTGLATAAALSTVSTNVDAILVDTGTSGVIVATNNDKTGYSIGVGGIAATAFAANAITAAAVAQDAGQEIADEVLNRDIAGGASGGTRNVRNALRALRNRQAIATGTLTVYQEDDTTSAWTAAVTTTAGNPITQIDPV